MHLLVTQVFMKKKRELKTLSLGSEPDTPEVPLLREFISAHRGIEADLTTFQMLRSCTAQQNAAIDEIAIGGKFCRSRLEEGLSWDDESGPHVYPDIMVADYSLLTRKGERVRSVHESPVVLPSCPSPDDEDAFAEMFHGFRQILRALRDIRVFGHIIHLYDPTPVELELVSGNKNLLFLHNPTLVSLEELLEHTSDLIIQSETIPFVDDLMDRFQVRTLILSDASEPALMDVLPYVDTDHLKVAGYGVGPEEEYWKKVKESAIIFV